MKYAIIVGHANDAMGQCSDNNIPCEWLYNMRVALELIDIADLYTHETYRNGYTSMVKRTASRVNKGNYKVVLSLHYNSFHLDSANGTEVLYHENSALGKKYAEDMANRISEHFGTRNRGAKPLSKGDRGFGEVNYTKPPTILLEPFFGSNEGDADKFRGCYVGYAKVIRDFLNSLN